MEIISCVGAGAVRPFRFNPVYPLIKKIQSIRLPLKTRSFLSRHSSERVFADAARPNFYGFGMQNIGRQKLGIRHFRKFSLKEFLVSAGDFVDFVINNVWLCALIAASISVPFVVTGVFNWNSGFAKSVHLAEIPSEELEILNKVMADFALDSSNEWDENGNVLNADGKVTSGISADFRQKVTFSDYKVQSGDTISGISKKFGLSNISTLIAVNNITNVRQIRSGQKLKIPSTDGLVYKVKSGDSLNALSVKYNVTVEDLLDVNDLESQVLTEGQALFIPGAKLSGDTLRMAMGELFAYPLSGRWRLTSSYGSRSDPFTGVKSFHTGIDMAMPAGTPVGASMSGKVATVGYTNIFGNYVIIKHINGYQTMYAHLTKALVKSGQNVSQGDKIGLVGSTGYSTGPHLHFMVFKNGKHIDPMTVLAKR